MSLEQPKSRGRFRPIQFDNKFGIRDQDVINEAETMFTTFAAIQGLPNGKFDIDHLKDIHRHLLGDMYDWAGSFRTERLIVNGTTQEASAPPNLLESETSRLLDSLAKEKVSEMNTVEFADTMARYYTRLYKLSPFPDGNARTSRFFLDKFAEQNGMQFKWEQMPGEAFNLAVDMSLAGKPQALQALFRKFTDYQDLADIYSTQRVSKSVSQIVETAGLKQEMIPSVEINSVELLGRFAKYAKQILVRDLELYGQGSKATLRDWDRTSIEHSMRDKGDTVSASQMLKTTLGNIEAKQVPRSPGLR